MMLVVNAASAAALEPGTGANWQHHAGGVDESGYSRLDQITSGNIEGLGLAWSLDLPDEVTLEATPIAVDGVLYFTGAYAVVYAVDAVSGRLLWKYDPEVWKHHPAKLLNNFAVNRGAAYADGRVYAASLDGRLFALEAKTGRLLWTAQTIDPKSLEYVTGAPRTFSGKVIIGNSGGDVGARGYVTAYDGATGKQVWRFYTVPGTPEQNKGDPAMERAAQTWSGEYWNTGTGGTVWNGITFDPELNRLYIGTGNGAPYEVAKRSPGDGDNLYLASIVALDADTGRYVWHYQANPREAWDYKNTQNIVMATLPIDGKSRKVLLQSPTNGFFYVLDRESGKLLSAEKTGKVTWAERIDLNTGRPVEAPNIRYEQGDVEIWPSPIGSHNWQNMSFSPRTGLVYIPYMQVGARFSKGAPWPGSVTIGGLTIGWAMNEPEDGKGALLAWDPVAQRARWKVQPETIWNGGTLTTAGNLVFQGTADGYFTAYDASNGQRLWRFNAGLGIIAAPSSFSAGGKQYVSVLVGYGGSASIGSNIMHVGWKYGAQPRRLLTFALDGKATLAPSAPPDKTVKAVDDSSIRIDPAEAEAGRQIFLMCALCHGRDLLAAGGPAPDLRESQLALDREAFYTVVHDGALLPKGMPKFDMLTREQIMQIWTYVRAGAREAAKPNR